EGATPTGTAFTDGAPADWGTSRPKGLGITGGDDFTVWWEGEIYLDAGEQTFTLFGDDMAFLDLQPPGGTFARVIAASWPNRAQVTYTAATSGWYGFHAAIAEGIGDASIDLELAPPGATAAAPIPPDRLRVRADALTGLSQWSFDDEG